MMYQQQLAQHPITQVKMTNTQNQNHISKPPVSASMSKAANFSRNTT